MTVKNLGVGTPSLGVPSPLNFWDFQTLWNLVYYMHDFETCVCLLDVMGVEFKCWGNIGGSWKTMTRDSDSRQV